MTSGLSTALASSSSTPAPANNGLGAWSAVPAIFSSVATALSGFSASRAQNVQAQYEQQQAALQRDEAYFQANQKAREVDRFQKEQIMQYANSGVLVAGSPLAVLADTARLGKQEVDAMKRRGDALYRIGMMKASMTSQSGRSSMLGGIFGGMSNAFSSFVKMKQLGLFSNTSTNPATGVAATAAHAHGAIPFLSP